MTGNQTAGFTGREPEFHVSAAGCLHAENAKARNPNSAFRKVLVSDYTIHLI